MRLWLRNNRRGLWLQRTMMRFLQKRGWVVFYLEEEHRICQEGTCWLHLYQQEMKRADSRP